MRHQHQADRVRNRARSHHACRAELVGDHAGQRLRKTVKQVLQRDGEGEHFAADTEIERHRLEIKAEAVARAQHNGHREAAARNDDGGRAPVFLC